MEKGKITTEWINDKEIFVTISGTFSSLCKLIDNLIYRMLENGFPEEYLVAAIVAGLSKHGIETKIVRIQDNDSSQKEEEKPWN